MDIVKYWVCCNCGEWNSFQVVQCIGVNCQHVYKGNANCNCRTERVKMAIEPNPPPSY